MSASDRNKSGAPPALIENDALFVDFDGTLAGIADDPQAIFLTPERQAALVAVSARLGGAAAIISGRSLSDLARRTPGALWRIGGHGAERAGPGEPAPAAPAGSAPAALRQAIDDAAATIPGVRVEPKGAVIAIHYRQAPASEAGLRAALMRVINAAPGYALHGGKMVFEAKPEGCDKGRAVAALMKEAPFAGRRPVMIGDDVTDEDAFRAVNEIGGRTIKVGDGETAARWRLADVDAVWRYLSGTAHAES